MATIPYDPTRQSLVHPGEANDFFQHGPMRSEAALCAEMSRLAYVDERARLEDWLTRGGWALIDSIGYGRTGTQAFVATGAAGGSRMAVLAFRGTEPGDPTDLFADARFERVAWSSGGTVHAGFRAALLEAYPDADVLARAIPTDVDRVLFTGHSLGAALATLAAGLRAPDHLYTFGSPLVGDAEFARSLAGVQHDRYVDCCDIVTMVPPPFAGYVHVGRLQYIDRHGKITAAPSGPAIEQDQRAAATAYLFTYAFLRGTVPVRGLADHTPMNYLSAAMELRSP